MPTVLLRPRFGVSAATELMAEAFHVRRSVEVIAHMRVPPAIAGGDDAKNSPFGERRILNVSQRSESSQTATAYRCSPGIGRSFIKPTLGVAELLFLTSSKASRHIANSSGLSCAASNP